MIHFGVFSWGAFQVHRIGKPPEFCGGIQAHLSILASPKVLEVVNTFPLEVPLNEVPRLNTWPTQFHNGGPKEDNIALYFFAKDLESYEKYYKVLMDTMVKNDLALKGNFDGVEFLIFPSNQLPQSCQRKACYKIEMFKCSLVPVIFLFSGLYIL
ncbi:hypothetical protein V6N13_063741 [Hibiscus sabdariffa]